MPIYDFHCKKCNIDFEEVCTFKEFDNNFPDVKCPQCNGKRLKKNVFHNSAPMGVFSDPRSSSKWDNWYYRQGFTAEKAKKERAAAEAEAKRKGIRGYKNIDDTDGGRRMNFID